MGPRHQKGSLSAKHEAKRGRGASPMASLPSRGANEKETLADEIRTIVRRRALSPGAAARLVDLPATRMSLLLNERLFSFTVRQLEKIRDALTA